ncbi:hypothetical protein TNCV_1958731 [Trichonephila clavipes]|nr:hypothetical protein TNCV_1958731 [Trichonephila clavipes]
MMADKDILKFVQSSQIIIDADSDDENEMNNAGPVPTSSEMGNIMKSMRSYLVVHSDGEMNNKMKDFDQFNDNLILKTQGKTIPGYFPNTQSPNLKKYVAHWCHECYYCVRTCARTVFHIGYVSCHLTTSLDLKKLFYGKICVN